MPKTKRYTPRTRSTPAQIQANVSAMSQGVSHGSPHSEPIAHTSPSINIEVQNDQTAPSEDQNPQPTQQEDQNPQHAYRRKSTKYWTVHLIDEEGVIKEDRLRVADVSGLSRDKKVILEWNREGQPIGEAAGLLGGFLGSLASNVNKFPISYEKWPDVPLAYKDHVWNNTIKEKFRVNDESNKKYIIANIGKKWKDNRVRLFAENYDDSLGWEENLELRPDDISREQWASFLKYRLSDKTREICEKNIANRLMQSVPHTLGSKTISRKKHELEIQTGRSYSRGEMYSIAHKKKDGTFVNDEAKQKSDLLDEQTEQMSSEEDAYTNVFGKENPGRVRGMGFGVCPSQVLGPAYCFGNSTMSSSSGDSSSELAKLKTELEASNARVEALEQEVAKVRSLEDQISFLMQNYGGQFPARFNRVTDLGSPTEARPSSSGSHNPQNHGPSSTA
ncbi:putative transposase, Ptta/En/Spm, plant [Sesbania bispinosa]|nr:putative transposase, Ptta/En/Spm, plant [Sesbania bispinosa]